jgi:hypothetical protein
VSEIPAAVITYMQGRQQSRAARLNEMVGALTSRELELIREAAVMGFVQGNMAQRGDIPGDSDIVTLVLRECDGMPDLYPMVAALPKRPRKRKARR